MSLSNKLERYWDSLRLEQIYLRELGLSLINADLLSSGDKTLLNFDDALRCYQSLKGQGRVICFSEVLRGTLVTRRIVSIIRGAP